MTKQKWAEYLTSSFIVLLLSVWFSSQVDLAHLLAARDQELRTLAAEVLFMKHVTCLPQKIMIALQLNLWFLLITVIVIIQKKYMCSVPLNDCFHLPCFTCCYFLFSFGLLFLYLFRIFIFGHGLVWLSFRTLGWHEKWREVDHFMQQPHF